MKYIALTIIALIAYVIGRLWWALRHEWTDIEPPDFNQ
jgi:hypothetical protein